MKLSRIQNSVVVLVGVSEYRPSQTANAAFTSIEQVERNVDCLASLLKPALNLESRVEVRSLKNPSSSDEMAGFIATAASVAEDLLLIYYSGHGLINSDGKLALSHSATELGMADFQALEYEKVRRACLASPARLKIVILGAATAARPFKVCSPMRTTYGVR